MESKWLWLERERGRGERVIYSSTRPSCTQLVGGDSTLGTSSRARCAKGARVCCAESGLRGYEGLETGNVCTQNALRRRRLAVSGKEVRTPGEFSVRDGVCWTTGLTSLARSWYCVVHLRGYRRTGRTQHALAIGVVELFSEIFWPGRVPCSSWLSIRLSALVSVC